MKNIVVKVVRNFYLQAILFIILLSAFTVSKGFAQESSLTFTVKPVKKAFIVGEPIQLRTEILNQGIEIVKIFPIRERNFVLFISQDSYNYKKFHFSTEFGLRRRKPVTLIPNQRISTSLNVLWNVRRPDYSHTVASQKKRARELDRKSKIITEYVFEKSGLYFIKASAIEVLPGANETQVEIMSDPIQIAINEPAGEDSEVWRDIKGDGMIALLMQGVTYPRSKKNKELITKANSK